MREKVLAEIRRHPNRCYAEIARSLGVSRSLIRYHAKNAGYDRRHSGYKLVLSRVLENKKLTAEQVASQLGVSVSTVRKRRREIGCVPSVRKKQVKRTEVESAVVRGLRRGLSRRDCACEFGCSESLVGRIARDLEKTSF